MQGLGTEACRSPAPTTTTAAAAATLASQAGKQNAQLSSLSLNEALPPGDRRAALLSLLSPRGQEPHLPHLPLPPSGARHGLLHETQYALKSCGARAEGSCEEMQSWKAVGKCGKQAM